MHEYILKNWRIVKVATTKAQRKLFFNLRKSKKRLGWLNAAEVRAVAADLNVSEREVLEMESRLSGRDIGFNAPRSEEHTSELQSLMRISYAVFCLKKKIQPPIQTHHTRTKVRN